MITAFVHLDSWPKINSLQAIMKLTGAAMFLTTYVFWLVKNFIIGKSQIISYFLIAYVLSFS